MPASCAHDKSARLASQERAKKIIINEHNSLADVIQYL
jgi:hypothetical protein